MRVSVIVPVRNEERFLEATLRSLLEQQFPADEFEVLAIDGQSTDATADVVRALQLEYPQLRLLDNPRRLSSAARNLGVAHSRGEFVLLVDGHCEVRNPHYLRQLVDAFERHGVDCVGRPQPLEVRSASRLQQAIAAARASRLGHNPGSHIYSSRAGYALPHSVGIAYRRCVFEQIGGFDESFDACEDVEFNYRVHRAGYRCYFAPELAVHYHPRGTLAGLAYQMQRYGRGRVRLFFKHPASLSLGPIVPAAFLVTIALTFSLGFVHASFATLFCATALLYWATVLAMTLQLGLGNALALPYLPGAFLAIHIGAGWGVLAEVGARCGRGLFGNLRPWVRSLPA